MKIFLTVGSRFPMDRLVQLVDEFVGQNPNFSCIAQIGDSNYKTKNLEAFKRLGQSKFTEYAKNADVIISHAGMGNIFLAVELKKPIIIMARKASLNEHINDHQLSTIKGFEDRNFIHSIEDASTLTKAVEWATQWKPDETNQTESAELTNYIKQHFDASSYKKVLAVSSAGGHWVQLKMLKPILDNYDVTYMTTRINSDDDIKDNNNIITVNDADITRKIKLLWLGLQTLFYVLKVRPDVVISTGAASGFFAILYAKFLRKETIWLDSVANYEKLSMSGKHAKKFSDIFLVQWSHLGDENTYKGSLI